MNNTTLFHYHSDALAIFIHNVHYYFKYIVLLSICVGLPANLFVLACAIRQTLFSSQMSAKSPLLYHYFILSITLADFFNLLTAVQVYRDFQDGLLQSQRPGPVLCYIIAMIVHITAVSSSMSLLCLNVDKFLAIIRPLHYASWVTKFRVILANWFCWLLGVAWAMGFAFGPWTTFTPPCEHLVNSWAYILFSVVFFAAPISVSGVLSSAIAVITLRAVRSKQIGIGISNKPVGNGIAGLSQKRRFGKVIFVFATTIWTCISLLPYRFMYAYYSTRKTGFDDAIPVFLFYGLLISSPAGNAVITICTQRRYRPISSTLKNFAKKSMREGLSASVGPKWRRSTATTTNAAIPPSQQNQSN